jgi:predicted ATPase
MHTFINSLTLQNFRSINTLTLRNIKSFSVFAGANGSGKSNFFDALDFAHWIVRFGVADALRAHGGVDNVRCYRRNDDDFKLDAALSQTGTAFSLSEALASNRKTQTQQQNGDDGNAHPVSNYFHNLYLYRVHPEHAKQPSLSNQDPSQLNASGSNLAAVLYRLEKQADIRDTIMDWLQLVVPTLHSIQAETERLTGSRVIAFLEDGLDKPFPPHLISDGSVYLLCLLVAVLDRGEQPCLTLIEEPERGLHPKAIQELVQLFREHATLEQPIWITTHSETVVRCLQNEELWLVGKQDGATQMKQIDFADELNLPLDQAWLSNALSGGLPW